MPRYNSSSMDRTLHRRSFEFFELKLFEHFYQISLEILNIVSFKSLFTFLSRTKRFSQEGDWTSYLKKKERKKRQKETISETRSKYKEAIERKNLSVFVDQRRQCQSDVPLFLPLLKAYLVKRCRASSLSAEFSPVVYFRFLRAVARTL